MGNITKIHLHHWEGGIGTKSNCHTSKVSLRRAKWYRNVLNSFLDCISGKQCIDICSVSQCREGSSKMLFSPQNHFFKNPMGQGVHCWSKGNWTPTDTISLLFGPKHICEVGLRNPPFFSRICFSPSEATSRACKRSFLTVLSGLGLSSGHPQNWVETELKQVVGLLPQWIDSLRALVKRIWHVQVF